MDDRVKIYYNPDLRIPVSPANEFEEELLISSGSSYLFGLSVNLIDLCSSMQMAYPNLNLDLLIQEAILNALPDRSGN